MIGFRSLPIEMPNGGTRLSTMSPPWLALVFSVCLMPCHILDGKYVIFFFQCIWILRHNFKSFLNIFNSICVLDLFQSKSRENLVLTYSVNFLLCFLYLFIRSILPYLAHRSSKLLYIHSKICSSTL